MGDDAPPVYGSRPWIVEAFPWMVTPGQRMVLGNDLDAWASACFMRYHYGWEPVGLFDLEHLYVCEGVTPRSLPEAVFVDVDVAAPGVRSIAHHIVTWQSEQELHGYTLNPNLLRGISHAEFRRKCPLSTFLLLLWITGKPLPDTPSAPFLALLADSVWYNLHTYFPNVQEWITHWMPLPVLTAALQEGRTPAYADAMRAFLDTTFAPGLPSVPPRTAFSGVKPPKGALTPYKCEVKHPVAQQDQIQAYLDRVNDLCGWPRWPLPRLALGVPGERTFVNLLGLRGRSGPHAFDVAATVAQERAFTYVFPNQYQGNMTRLYFERCAA